MPPKRGQKRKATEGGCSKANKRKEICVIHSKKSNGKSFISMDSKKDPEVIFQKLKQIRNMRMEEPVNSIHRLEHECSQIPEELNINHHGYHRDCYQMFTRNLSSLHHSTDASSNKFSETSEQKTRSNRSQSTSERVIFNPDCIFCNKDKKSTKKETTGQLNAQEFLNEMDGIRF